MCSPANALTPRFFWPGFTTLVFWLPSTIHPVSHWPRLSTSQWNFSPPLLPPTQVFSRFISEIPQCEPSYTQTRTMHRCHVPHCACLDALADGCACNSIFARTCGVTSTMDEACWIARITFFCVPGMCSCHIE